MNKLLKLIGFFTVITLVVTSCKPKYEKPEASKGEIDPTRFVMIGGAHSSGYMNDALYYEGQKNSLAALISNQLSLVGGNLINHPFVNANSVGIGLTGLSHLKLGYKTDCKGVTSLSPVRVSSTGDLSVLNDNLYSSTNSFGNYGVPGLKLMQVASANYAQSNSFFSRMASTTNTSVLDDIISTNSTFFTSFLGILLAWFVASYNLYSHGAEIFTAKMARLFSLPVNGIVFLLITSTLMGLVGALAGFTGNSLRNIIIKPKDKTKNRYGRPDYSRYSR
jgi:hypothetical protein